MALEPFCHEPLPDALEYMRLVKIHPAPKKDPITVTIEAHERFFAPDYAALSYTWGDRQLTKSISANGKLLLVTANCWYALGQLRLHDVCNYCWVDAMCINQSDDAEKSAQVNLMGNIYRNAALGAIAVGRHDRATEALFRILIGLGIADDPIVAVMALEQAEADVLECLARGVTALGMRAYWNRLWIVQEFALLSEALILCGNGCVRFDAITAVARALQDISRGKDSKFATRYDRILLESTPMSATVRLRQTIRESPEGLTAFDKLLDLLGPRECDDVRDRIFGILSLAQWSGGVKLLTADYSLSRSELASQVLRLYRGPQLEITGRVLRLLDIGSNDPGMWATWEHRSLAEKHMDISPSHPRSPGQRASLRTITQAFRITHETVLYPWSQQWCCLTHPLEDNTREGRPVDFEAWLRTRPILLPASSRPGDVLVRISRWELPIDGMNDSKHLNRNALVLRPIKSTSSDLAIVGHALFFPDNDFSSIRTYNLEAMADEVLYVYFDDDDLLFWKWQQMHWGSKPCETLQACDQQLEVFAARFCHSPLSSFAISWARPEYQTVTSELGALS